MSPAGQSHKPGEASPAGAGSAAAPYPSSAPPVAVVVSRYNASITGKLLDGAVGAYFAAGGDPAGVTVVDAPGAYELVGLSNAAAGTGRFAGVVALGCIIRGDTEHDRYIASAVAHGLTQVTVATGVPVAFGVLTVNTVRQARERAGGVHGNKGAEAMEALLSTVRQVEALRAGRAPGAAAAAGLPDKARGNGASRKANAGRGAR